MLKFNKFKFFIYKIIAKNHYTTLCVFMANNKKFSDAPKSLNLFIYKGLMVLPSGIEPESMVPKKLKPIAKSSTFRIIFYHKISYKKSFNPFIYQHFRHFILSNKIIQYKHLKIQHKTPHLQKSCIFLAKICNNY